MPRVKRLVLDVLKPHQPNALEFAKALAETGSELVVELQVVEVDERTESVMIEIRGEDLGYERIERCVADLGASVHSIDGVEVQGDFAEPDTTD